MATNIFKQEEEEIKKFKELRKKEEENFTIRTAQKLGLPYANLLTQSVNLDALVILDEESSRNGEIAVIAKQDFNLKVCVKNPNNPKTISVIDSLKKRGFKVDIYLVSTQSLKKAWDLYADIIKKGGGLTGEIEITPENLWKIQEAIKNIEDFKKIFETTREKSTSMILEVLIAGSLSLDSSDMHIEPGEKDARVRFRIDGLLQEATSVSVATYKHLLNRIKLLSELKINITDTPQDGRFSISTNDKAIEIRTSVLPGPNGESMVLRILNPAKLTVAIEELGFLEHDLKTVGEELKKPNGLIVVTGPTGSGKTTTLYSFIKKINTTGIKIITIEDPIEYHIEGISQSQVEPEKGYTFASGLRSILRQDPDVILVGEMRDSETADIGIHASLTGHLVLSTLHTNDAPSAVLRLIDMGLNPNILTPAINSILAQRLVRKVCKFCSQKRKATAEEITMMKKILSDMPSGFKMPEINENTEVAVAVGCIKCNNSGYKGRVGVFEIFTINKDVEDVVAKNPSQTLLIEIAKKNGMIQMQQDGVLKVLAGITTIEEIDRVSK
ncbi:type II/IV secretion system protein [Candidatus Azambacteria bacterium]|nr:type II/IV secretion system protein [Candidatus Azambacteria bacterium]